MQDFINCEASICTIFNLDSSILESCSCIRRNEQTIIDVKLLDSRPACPECGNPITKIKGYVTKTIQHSLLADKKCVLQYHARRYICPICHKTFYEYNPFVFQNMKISSDLMLQILKDLQEPLPTQLRDIIFLQLLFHRSSIRLFRFQGQNCQKSCAQMKTMPFIPKHKTVSTSVF